MPAQVVVVKRSRGRAFAILRSIPAWLRAVATSLRSVAPNDCVDLDLGSIEAFAGSELLAPDRRSGILVPNRVDQADLAACASCRRCVEICPSAALGLEFEAQDPQEKVLRFDIDSGRCIGCGDCVGVCPAGVLEMRVAEDRIGAGARPMIRSLLGEDAVAREN